MVKTILIILIVAAVGVTGLLFYKNMKGQSVNPPILTNGTNANQPTTEQAVPLSPIFSYLPAWVPAAVWSTPQKVTNDTPYGKLTGMEETGKITGGSTFKGRNFEDTNVLSGLGFISEDIKFAADGPGASNWGYTKTENGQSQVVTFSYSTNRLLGPESKSSPFANISVFVSDPFTMKQ